MKPLRSVVALAIGAVIAVGASNLYAQTADKPAPSQQSEKRVETSQTTCPCCGATLSEEAIKKLEAFRAEWKKFRAEREKFRQDRREFRRGDRPTAPRFGRGDGPRFQPRPFERRRFGDAPAAPPAPGRWFGRGRWNGAPPMGARPGRFGGWMKPPVGDGATSGQLQNPPPSDSDKQQAEKN